MNTIAIINQKGGVGKSTTVQALAAGLTKAGKKVLSVDLDRQRNLTQTAGIEATATVLDVMTGRAAATDAIKPSHLGDVMAADTALNSLEQQIPAKRKEYVLKGILEPLKGKYDFIIIDTPPALGLLTVNALTAADSIIIPAGADIYSLQGISDLSETIAIVKQYTNPALTIKGILLTRYSGRNVLSRDLSAAAADIAEQLQTKVFTATIRQAIAVQEAQTMRQNLFDYAPRAKVTADYKAFVAEATGVKI